METTAEQAVIDEAVALDEMSEFRLGALRSCLEMPYGDARISQAVAQYVSEYSYTVEDGSRRVPDIDAELAAYAAAHPEHVHPDRLDSHV